MTAKRLKINGLAARDVEWYVRFGLVIGQITLLGKIFSKNWPDFDLYYVLVIGRKS